MIFLNYIGKIDYPGASEILDCLSRARVDGQTEVALTIASPGGITNVGLMLFNQISALPISVTTYSVGFVDSAAFSVFLAGDRRIATPSSSLIIHLPKKGFDPNARFSADDLKLMAQDLIQNERDILSTYATRMSSGDAEIRKWLTEGKRFTPEEALASGVATAIEPLVYPADAKIYTLGGKD